MSSVSPKSSSLTFNSSRMISLQSLHAALEARVAVRRLVDYHDLPQGLAGLYGCRVAGCPPEAHDTPRRRHPPRESPVHQRLLVSRPVSKVNALGRLRVRVRDEVLVERFCDERGEGCGELRHGHEALVEGGVGRLLVRVVLTLPETAPAAPHVPVGELVHELPDGPPGRRDVVGVEPLGHRPDGELRAR